MYFYVIIKNKYMNACFVKFFDIFERNFFYYIIFIIKSKGNKNASHAGKKYYHWYESY